MQVLIDSSAWIEYFNNSKNEKIIDNLIDNNQIVTNSIILCELVPFLQIAKEKKLIQLLNQLPILKINLDWNNIIQIQTKLLKNGINGIGIPDLIILTNAKIHNAYIFSYDKHFKLMQSVIPFREFKI